jgi:hypothetical protein
MTMKEKSWGFGFEGVVECTIERVADPFLVKFEQTFPRDPPVPTLFVLGGIDLRGHQVTAIDQSEYSAPRYGE